ncbi:MAG: ABC transporter ATP-binding protein [Chloroflexi bacterium]|nr:ABC transporter ATP-binding protein [Chloroflexota bacterium]
MEASLAHTPSAETERLVSVSGLTRQFPVGRSLFRRATSFIHAVDDVSFQLSRGDSLGLVGESGCGKTTVGKLLVKLIEPTSGHITYRLPGLDVGEGTENVPVESADISGGQLRAFRRQVQMIFQDPYESMNPRRTIYDTIAEPLAVQGMGTVLDRVDMVSEILMLVGLTPPATFLFRHPHELSGGQRQRVAIARALVVEPSFVVADEPTSMLDVSSRTGIMNLMQQLAHGLGIAYLYVTHDLAVARYMCHRIAVMYLGKIVELGETEELLRNPLHPYTRALLSAVPVPDPGHRREPPNIVGDLTAPIDPPARCRFYDRCPLATHHCRDNPHPAFEEKAPDHWVACYEV